MAAADPFRERPGPSGQVARTSHRVRPEIILIQNWFDELKRFVPTD